MTKRELVQDITERLPFSLTVTERQHLEFYPAKPLLEALTLALREPRRDGHREAPAASLAEKATVLVRWLGPSLRGYPAPKAISELANTTHGVLDKLLEGL